MKFLILLSKLANIYLLINTFYRFFFIDFSLTLEISFFLRGKDIIIIAISTAEDIKT